MRLHLVAEVFWSGTDCELFSIVSNSGLLLANAIAWWSSETQCLATNFAQRFLTTTFLHGSTFVDPEHFCETKRLLTQFSRKE